MRSKVWIVFISLLLVNCRNKSRREQIECFLTGGHEKYWTYIPTLPSKYYQGTVFKANGTFLKYVTSHRDEKARLIASVHDVLTWKLINDSIISFGSFQLKIEYISNDVMILNSMSLRNTLIYLRAQDQQTVPVEDTTRYLYPSL